MKKTFLGKDFLEGTSYSPLKQSCWEVARCPQLLQVMLGSQPSMTLRRCSARTVTGLIWRIQPLLGFCESLQDVLGLTEMAGTWESKGRREKPYHCRPQLWSALCNNPWAAQSLRLPQTDLWSGKEVKYEGHPAQLDRGLFPHLGWLSSWAVNLN